MEVLSDMGSANPVLLPNAEVLQLLKHNVKDNKRRFAKIQASKNNQNKTNNKKQHTAAITVVAVDNKFQHRDWIQEKVFQYLKQTPCVYLPTSKKMDELSRKCCGRVLSRGIRGNEERRNNANANKISSPGEEKSNNNKSSPSSSSSSFGLTEAETLQVLNFMPQEPVEIHLMVEELHARMSEEGQSEFLDLIRSHRSDNTTTTNNSKASSSKKEKTSDGGGGNLIKEEDNEHDDNSNIKNDNEGEENDDDNDKEEEYDSIIVKQEEIDI
jgi:RNA polymerase Rpb4